MRPIKRAEVNSIIGNRRRFKLVHVAGSKFVSVLAGRARDFTASALEYAEGRVTESRAYGCADSDTEGTKLIYLYDDLNDAIADAKILGTPETRANDTRAIFEALPVGFFRENKMKEGVTLCEAVLIGKEVWRETLPKPETDVSKELTVKLCGYGSKFIELYHGVHRVANIGCNGVVMGGLNYELIDTKSGGAHEFRIIKKS